MLLRGCVRCVAVVVVAAATAATALVRAQAPPVTTTTTTVPDLFTTKQPCYPAGERIGRQPASWRPTSDGRLVFHGEDWIATPNCGLERLEKTRDLVLDLETHHITPLENVADVQVLKPPPLEFVIFTSATFAWEPARNELHIVSWPERDEQRIVLHDLKQYADGDPNPTGIGAIVGKNVVVVYYQSSVGPHTQRVLVFDMPHLYRRYNVTYDKVEHFPKYVLPRTQAPVFVKQMPTLNNHEAASVEVNHFNASTNTRDVTKRIVLLFNVTFENHFPVAVRVAYEDELLFIDDHGTFVTKDHKFGRLNQYRSNAEYYTAPQIPYKNEEHYPPDKLWHCLRHELLPVNWEHYFAKHAHWEAVEITITIMVPVFVFATLIAAILVVMHHRRASTTYA